MLKSDVESDVEAALREEMKEEMKMKKAEDDEWCDLEDEKEEYIAKMVKEMRKRCTLQELRKRKEDIGTAKKRLEWEAQAVEQAITFHAEGEPSNQQEEEEGKAWPEPHEIQEGTKVKCFEFEL